MGILTAQLPQKVIILRPLQFGDLMCSVPAFRALRSAIPSAEITLIGLPWAAEFVQRFSRYLDRWIGFPGFPGFPEQQPRLEEFPDFLKAVQAERFDLAVQMHGSGNLSNSLIELLGAKQSAGFYLEGLFCPDPDTYLPYPVTEPEIWRHLKLMQFLGIPIQGDELEFPITEAEWRDSEALRENLKIIPGEYIVLHPGARAAERRWAPERFADAADWLAQNGLQIVLTGSREEEEIVRAVQARMSMPAVNACGLTSYGTMAALLSGARLVICNDTGVSHLAAALRVPSVVLFLASEPERWAPLDQTLHRRILWASAAQPEAVIREADHLLRKERVYAA